MPFASSNGDKFLKIGLSGLVPLPDDSTTDLDRSRNEYIISHASIFYDGKSCLYINPGLLFPRKF
jgi:hypothetical protein